METLYEEALPSIWGEDGITHSSLVYIPANCPKGHSITFMANYELKVYDNNRRILRWGKVTLEVGGAGVDRQLAVDSWQPTPALQVAPNPMRDRVSCLVPEGTVILIHDNKGNLIGKFWGGPANSWDGTDINGRSVRPGIYFITAKNGSIARRKRIIKVK